MKKHKTSPSCSTLPACFLNPIDHVIYKLCDTHLTPIFQYLNVSANWITILGLLCGLGGTYMLCRGNIIGFWLFMSIYWIMDSLDGCYARKYKCTSQLGSYLDPIVDITVGGVILWTAWYRYGSHSLLRWPWVIVGVVVLVSTCLYYACVDAYKEEEENGQPQHVHPWYRVSCVRRFCQQNTRKKLRVLRWFTGYTYILIMVLAMAWMEKNKMKR